TVRFEARITELVENPRSDANFAVRLCHLCHLKSPITVGHSREMSPKSGFGTNRRREIALCCAMVTLALSSWLCQLAPRTTTRPLCQSDGRSRTPYRILRPRLRSRSIPPHKYSNIAELLSVSFGNRPKFRQTFARCSAPCNAGVCHVAPYI